MNNWKESFVQEFGIHFSKSELQFALEFIQHVEATAIRRCDKVYGEKLEKAAADAFDKGLGHKRAEGAIMKACNMPVIEGSEQFLKNIAYEEAAKELKRQGYSRTIAKHILNLKS